MLLFCEECGEKYVFEDDDPSIEGTEFECRTCGEMIRVPGGAALDAAAGKSDQ